MKDRVADARRKSRFIVELRYAVIPEFLDHRGRFIGSAHPQLLPRFKDWDARVDSIWFTDTRTNPLAEVLVGSKRTSVIMEDPDSLQLFLDTTEKVIGLVHQELGSWIGTLARVGARIITVAQSPFDSYDDTLAQVIDRFHKTPMSLPFKIHDTQAVIVHDYGRFAIGPTRPGDDWLKAVFKKPDHNVPAAGIALDIDSYAQQISVSSVSDIRAAVTSALNMSLAVEEDLVSAMRAAHVTT